MSLHLSQDLPSLCTLAVLLHLAEALSAPECGRQPATAETTWALSQLVTSVPGRKNAELCIGKLHNK